MLFVLLGPSSSSSSSSSSMSSECTAVVARDVSRSVPGALREHPGSVPREGARPTGPIGIPYKSQKGSSVNRNIQRKTQMFQKTTNLTTIFAILGVPTTLFGGSSGRGTRQRAPEGRLGGCQVWRDLNDLCKIQKTYTLFVIS